MASATLAHTAAQRIAASATVALVVFGKAGPRLLRKAWFSLHLVWAAALIVTGTLTVPIA